jgi:hypothetical protein
MSAIIRGARSVGNQQSDRGGPESGKNHERFLAFAESTDYTLTSLSLPNSPAASLFGIAMRRFLSKTPRHAIRFFGTGGGCRFLSTQQQQAALLLGHIA